MRKLNVFIAEDDVFISEELKDMLEDMNYSVVGIGYDYTSSIEIIGRSEIDVAILDIKMHGKDQGFQIAEFIKRNKNIPIIFLTSFSDQMTVEEAIQYDPRGYIVKPFNQRDLYTTLEVVKLQLNAHIPPFIIKSGHEQVLVDPSEIRYIKADDKYIEIYTTENRYVERNSLNSFMMRLKNTSFIRLHRSFIVNTNFIDKITNNTVIIGQEVIPLSRKYKEEFLNQMEDKT